MMKKKRMIMSFLLIAAMAMGLAGCSGNPAAAGKTTVVLWGYADEMEAESIYNTVNWYNENNTDGIYIDYYPQPGGTYVSLAERALASNKGPDVFYVGDRYLKRWAKYGYLENIQSYVDEAGIDFSTMWQSAQYRYRYDPVNNTNNIDDPLYALPKDISSSALYYNATVMEDQGIKIISVDEEDLDAFNAGGEDRNGNTKADLGIPADFTVPAKGFYREQPYTIGLFTAPTYGTDGKVIETMIFNNRIAMSWDEIEDLAMILTKSYNPNLGAEDTTWGYYTEYWFNYGWGVGGDCAVDTTGNGDWEFTLGDKTQKRLVYNADGSYVTDEFGKAVFVAEGEEYELADGQYLGELLPSQYEAFERFVLLGKPKEYGGLAIAPRQSQDIGLQSSTSFFSDGRVAMLVETSEKAISFRNSITDFEWDVAPLPVYKEYAADGVTVVNRGIEVGHSGSTGLAVWTKSNVKAEAFKVAQYFSTGYAQTLQAQTGYMIPNDMALAQTEYVQYNLDSGQAPKNISIFTRMAESSRPGDWWYMPDNLWIDNWATPLNTEYRENAASLDDFFAAYTDSTNAILRQYKEQGFVGGGDA